MMSPEPQDDKKNPNVYPTWTITEIAALYGYTRAHVANLVRYGYLHSHKITYRNQPVILVHTESMNQWVRMQQNRRAS